MYFLSIMFGICLGQSIPKAAKDFYNVEYSFYRVHQLISAVKGLDAIGQIGRKSYLLPQPRTDYGVTPEDVEYFLQHSLIPNCSNLDECFCKGKFANLKMFRNESFDSQAAVALDQRNKLIIVAYRGSISTKNWDTNFRSELINYPNLKSKIKVHQGQYEHFASLQPQLEVAVTKLLNDTKYKDYKLHVTGFSLGASVAAISLPTWIQILASRGIEKQAQLYIYSGPRPGNMEFAKHLETLDIPLVRYAKNGDVIPHVPEQTSGYSHVGQEFYDPSLFFRKRAVVKCATDVIEDGECLLGDSSFHAIDHIFPFQRLAPLPPFC